MSRVEDVLRETMRARDLDAPPSAGFRFHPPAAPPRSGFRWVPAVAVAGSVAMVIGIVVAVVPHSSRKTTARPAASSAVLSCPTRLPAASPPRDLYPLPPRRPDALDVSDRLAPTATPAQAVVCAYLHGDAGALTGSRVLDGGLAALPDTLAWLPSGDAATRPCAAYLGAADGDSYLVGLSYPHGTTWVTAPGNHCLGSSNGRFLTSTHVATDAAAAYRAGRWTPPAPTLADGCPTTPGRLGQEKTLVPDAPISVLVCQNFPHHSVSAGFENRSRAGTSADLAALMTALNALPTEPDGQLSNCGVTDSVVPVATYRIVFSYGVGPSVAVSIAPDCLPAVSNGSLQVTVASGLVPIVARILGR